MNRFFKTESAIKAMDKIWSAATELEKNKIALISLSFNGEDVLEHLDAKDFIEAAWKMFSPLLMKALRNSARANSPIPSGDEFDESYIREKVALLGESGSAVLMMLGLERI